MPTTFYAQKPTLEMKHNMNVGFGAIGSIGSANASSIATTYRLPGGSTDNFNNTASNELAMYDVGNGEMEYYDQMVVGNVIKRGFGQIGEATK
jgi:hypothetical protein